MQCYAVFAFQLALLLVGLGESFLSGRQQGTMSTKPCRPTRPRWSAKVVGSPRSVVVPGTVIRFLSTRNAARVHSNNKLQRLSSG